MIIPAREFRQMKVWPCGGSLINSLGGTSSTVAITPTSDLNNQLQNDPRKLFTITGRTLERIL